MFRKIGLMSPFWIFSRKKKKKERIIRRHQGGVLLLFMWPLFYEKNTTIYCSPRWIKGSLWLMKYFDKMAYSIHFLWFASVSNIEKITHSLTSGGGAVCGQRENGGGENRPWGRMAFWHQFCSNRLIRRAAMCSLFSVAAFYSQIAFFPFTLEKSLCCRLLCS